MGGEGLYICKEVLAAAGVEESSHTAGHVASMGGEGLYICKEVLAAAGVEESSHTAGGACYVSGLCPDNASVCSTAVPPRQQSCSSYQATTLGSGSSTEMTRNRGLDEWQHGLPSASGSEWRSLAPTPAAAVREEAGEAQAAAEAVLALGSSESSGLQRESWQMRLSVGSEVRVWSGGAQQWVDAVVTCVSREMVMLQFFRDQRCCLKRLPLSSPELQRKVLPCGR